MVQIVNPGNGQIAGLSIAEITSVPYYELLHTDPDRACRTVQVTFSRILDGFYRQMPQNAASLELLCQSCAIQNQTYDAQVKLYLLIRMLGSAAEEFALRRKLEDLSRTLAAELGDLYGLPHLCISKSFHAPFSPPVQINILCAISRLTATRASLTLTITLPPIVFMTVTTAPGTNPRSSRCFLTSGDPDTRFIMFSSPGVANTSGILHRHPFTKSGSYMSGLFVVSSR